MTVHVFREYEAKPRAALGTPVVAGLQAFDERLARSAGETIFDWSRAGAVRAKNYVGVIQAPGFQVEILPKTDVDDNCARRNLVYMLGVTRRLPVRERDMASLRVDRLPVYEALVRLFAKRLLTELQRGLDHQYVQREDNAGFVRGKIVLPVHLCKNLANKERVYVRYDEFLADTWLNRCLKAACRVLLRQTRAPEVQHDLREAVLMFSDVEDVIFYPHQLDLVQMTRGNQRFEDLYSFARIVLFEGAPAPEAGDRRTFSLLVPMDRLFEEFVGILVRRHSQELGYSRSQVHLQAQGRRRYLLARPSGGKLYQLRPDVLIDDGAGGVARVLDTKWKRLDSARQLRPSEADMYQLYAYSHRYGAPLSVLLYPHMPGLVPREYELDGDPRRRKVRVAFLNMSRDLRTERAAVAAEIALTIDAEIAALLPPEPSPRPRAFEA